SNKLHHYQISCSQNSESVMLNVSPASHEVSPMRVNFASKRLGRYRQIAALLLVLFIASPVVAQQPAASTTPPKQTPNLADPTLEALLATDGYKLYGEVRKVG